MTRVPAMMEAEIWEPDGELLAVVDVGSVRQTVGRKPVLNRGGRMSSGFIPVILRDMYM